MKEVDHLSGWEDEGGAGSQDESDNDPLSSENALPVQTITLLRIYDVLMVQLQLTNPTAADKLYKLHAAGGFATPAPAYDPKEVL